MKNKNVFISGVSGSGKDFILEKLDLPPNSKCFHFGSFLKESAEKIENKNFKSGEIGNMSKPKIDLIEDGAIKALKPLLAHEKNILNCHLTYKINDQIQTDKKLVHELEPSDIIMIESDPYEILYRRATNLETRNRKIEAIDQINEQQEIEREYIRFIAKKIGIRTIFICNNFSNLSNNIDILNDFLRN